MHVIFAFCSLPYRPLFAQLILPPMLVDLSLTTYEFLTPDGQSASIQAPCDVVKVNQALERCSNRCKRVIRYDLRRLAKNTRHGSLRCLWAVSHLKSAVNFAHSLARHRSLSPNIAVRIMLSLRSSFLLEEPKHDCSANVKHARSPACCSSRRCYFGCERARWRGLRGGRKGRERGGRGE